MARLIVDTEQFSSLGSGAVFEKEFERVLVQESERLFPGFFCVPFTEPVNFKGVWKKPDLALIDKQYRIWWVVEVELSHHSLDGHIIPQIEVFTYGDYGSAHAEALIAKGPELEPEKVIDMVRGSDPKVLVVVNETCPDWVRPLQMFGAELAVVEVFRSDTRPPMFRVNGYDVRPPATTVTTCRLDPLLPRMLIVDTPALIPADEDGLVEINLRGASTRWRRIDTADRTWLTPERSSPIPDEFDGSIEIEIGDDGNASFHLGD